MEFIKDPEARLDYQIDWSTWLGADTISASTWSATSGITIDSDANTTTTATVWLSGGTLGQTYEVTNHITTAAAREDDRTLFIRIFAQ
jgi:hypothetical protein